MNENSDEQSYGVAGFEVGVAVKPLSRGLASDAPGITERDESGGVPGYEDLSGRKRAAVLIERGERFADAATEALAAQIARSADHIARVINEKVSAQPVPGRMDLDSVDVSFGVTFSTGVQALFTAQAESSALVTITLRRRGETQ